MSKGMNKEVVVEQLKSQWDTLQPKEKKDLIYSLLGHRLSLKTIAELTSRSITEVKEAYKGEVLMQTLTSEPEPDQVVIGLEFETEGISSKAASVTPMKGLYTLTFDEILAKYRDWIGMKVIVIPGPTRPADGMVRGAIVSDLHVPFHDEQAFANFIKDAKESDSTDVCILGGDGPDFHNYSRYAKYGQHFTIQDEHKSFMSVLAILSETFEEVVMIPGNHDERTRKKYAQLLPADLYQSLMDFHGGNAFDFSELMTRQFENIIIPTPPKHGFAEYRFIYQFYDIVVGHPEVYSKIPNKSVGSFIDWLKRKALPMGLIHDFKYAVMGHTHMAGKTWNDFATIGIENGCLAMTPDYDANARLAGAIRPPTHGYTRFATNGLTGVTNPNDINFIQLE